MASRSLGTLTLDLILQMGGLESGLSQADRSLQRTQDMAARAERAFNKMTAAIDPLQKKARDIASLNKELEASLSAGMINQQEYQHYKSLLDQQSRALWANTEAAKAFAAAQAEAERSEAKFSASIDALKAKLDPVGTSLEKLAKDQETLNLALSGNKISTAQYEAMSSSLAKLRQEVDGTAERGRRLAQVEAQDAAALKHLRDSVDPTAASLRQLREQKELINAQLLKGNLEAEEYRKLSASIEEARKALARLNGEHGNSGSSGTTDHQRQFADRYLPNQVHDAGRSLLAGMSPLTVILEQGSQVKDMYGSIGEAAQGVGRYLKKMINPWVLTAVAIAGVAAAAYSANERLEAMSRGLILAGRSSMDIDAAASRITNLNAKISGVSYSTISDAYQQVASNAQIAGSDIERVTEAAVELAHAGGQKAKETAAEFASIGKDPVAAITVLNDKYGIFDASVAQVTLKLREQGNETEAAAIEQRLYLDTIEQRAKDAAEHLSPLTSAWEGIKESTTDAINQALIYFKLAPSTLNNKIMASDANVAELEDRKKNYWSWGKIPFNGLNDEALEAAKKENAELHAQADEANKKVQAQQDQALKNSRGAAAAIKADSLREKGLSKDEQKKVAVDKAQALIEAAKQGGAKYTAAEEKAIIEGAMKPFEEKSKKEKGYHNEASFTYLDNLKQQTAELKGQLTSSSALTDSSKDLLKFNERIRDINEKIEKGGKSKLTTEEKSLLTAQDAIRAQYKVNAGLEEQIAKKKRLDEMHGRGAQLVATSKEGLSTLKEQNADSLTAYDQSSTTKERLKAYQKQDGAYLKSVAQLNKGTTEEDRSDPQYQADLEALKAVNSQKVEEMQSYYASIDALQSDWTVGMRQSMNDYLSSASNLAGSMKSVFDSAFSGMESALSSFVKTGKLDFSSLVDSVIDGLAKIAIQQSVLGLAGMFGFGSAATPTLSSAGLGGASAVTGDASILQMAAHADGGLISGEGNGTSDSIPAWLSNGEFVMNAKATSQFLPVLKKMNNHRYATGGIVGSSPMPQVGSSSTNNGGNTYQVSVSVDGGNKDPQQLGQQVGAAAMKAIAQQEINKAASRNGGAILEAIRSNRK